MTPSVADRAAMLLRLALSYERGMQDAAPSRPSADDWAPAGRSRANEVGSRLEEVVQILEAAPSIPGRMVLRFHREHA
jgi:hypothetical protein